MTTYEAFQIEKKLKNGEEVTDEEYKEYKKKAKEIQSMVISAIEEYIKGANIQQLYESLKQNNIYETVIVFIKNNDDNTIDKEILTFDCYEGYEWLNDWYEGQDFEILGYTKIDNIQQIDVKIN